MRVAASVTMIAVVVLCRTANAADAVPSAPLSCRSPTPIHFSAGTSAGHFDEMLQRWQQDCFVFSARQGQHVTVDLVDGNRSASLAIYAPGYEIRYGNTTEAGRYVTGWSDLRIPINTYRGTMLTTPLERQEAAVQSFAGRLPATGRYLIVVALDASGASTFGGRIAIR